MRLDGNPLKDKAAALGDSNAILKELYDQFALQLSRLKRMERFERKEKKPYGRYFNELHALRELAEVIQHIKTGMPLMPEGHRVPAEMSKEVSESMKTLIEQSRQVKQGSIAQDLIK